MNSEIVPRREWGAMDALGGLGVTFPVDNMVYYYSNTRSPQCYSMDECKEAMLNLQKMHKYVLKMPDIAFNFVITGDGRIYEGRGWHFYPPRFKFAQHMNKKGFLIGILGDLKDRPTQTTWDATWRILKIAYKNHYVTEDVFLSAQDLIDNSLDPGVEEEKQSIPTEETKLKLNQLSADLKPSIDLKSFWKDPLDDEF